MTLSRLREQRGSVAVLVALAITCLIGMAALAVDVGVLFLNKAQLVNIADAAALATARDLLPDRAGVDPASTAGYLADLNGRLPGDTLAVSVDAGVVTITVTRKVDLMFARIWGLTSSDVQATAQATAGVLASATGVVPFGVVKKDFEYGIPYILKAGGGDGDTGNFGGLALGGDGATVYEFNIENGYQGTLYVNQMIDTKTGNMSGKTSEGVNSRISSDPTAGFPPQDFTSPRIVTVPVIESLDIPGSSGQVKIVGFANFFLESVGGSGNQNYVTGRFLKMAKPGEISSTAGFYGAYNVKLIK